MTMTIAEATSVLTAPGQIFEVGEETVRGIPLNVWKNAPPSLRAVLEMSRGHGDNAFLVYEDERMTFEEHFRAAAPLATRLVNDYGVTKGDRVAIAMRNFPEWPVAFWAAAAAGAVVVPLNAWWTGPELEYGITDSGSKVLFLDGERDERLASHLGGIDLAGVVVARPDGALHSPGAERFDDVLGDGWQAADVAIPDVRIDPEDDATIFYTSGTTGAPKGALGTHRNICGNLVSLGYAQARAAQRAAADRPSRDPAAKTQNVYLLSVPFFHATGCHSVLVANTAAGGKIVILHKWDAERALELIEREKVTTFGGVPSMVWQVLESPSFDKRDTSSV